MTPEELEAYRKLSEWLKADAPMGETLDEEAVRRVFLAANALPLMLAHIDQQAAQIIDLRKQIGTLQDTRDGWIKLFSEQTFKIAEQAAQIAAPKEIVAEERASRLTLPAYGCIAVEEEYCSIDPKNARIEACQQLEAEHPEAMR